MMNKLVYRRYPVTCIFIILCVLVYFYTSVRYSFDMNAQEGYLAGGMMPLAILYDHEYYRFFTANLIHFGLLHLVMNMFSLYNIGPFMEEIFGRKRYVVLLVGSGLATTVLPYIYYRLFASELSVMGLTVSGGASGVILGLLGGLCYLSFRYRGLYARAFRSILPSLVLVVLVSVTVPSISLSGHLGGFIGGVLVTFLIDQLAPHSTWKNYFYGMN